MIYRRHKAVPPAEDERKAEEALRAALPGSAPGGTPELPPEYWSNLLVRTNRRIDDEAASPRAISLSWALRVAIPGVAAIIAFLVGVRYYAPEPSRVEGDLLQAVAALPVETIDSLLALRSSPAGQAGEPAADDADFEVSPEQIADYLVGSGASGALFESLSDEELNEVLHSLSVATKSL